MLIIVLATGACGFLFSFILLRLGLETMWIRYPVAVGLAYLVFFLLLRLWLVFGGVPLSGSDVLDAADVSLDIASTVGEVGSGTAEGASASDAASALDAAEFWPLVAIAGLLGGIIACLYVIYTAPSLLAEVVVDGALVSALYSRLKKGECPHWVYGAIRRTWVPALVAAIFFGVAGFALAKAVPGAHSIGEVIHRSRF
jgi:hypothetical protein